MLKVAITGPSGLIGSRIIELLDNDFEFISLDQPAFDITKKDLVFQTITDTNFDILLHLAAYTNVDGAETNKELVAKINIEGTRHVFEAVMNKGKKMIHISTDFIFDGTSPPYFEDAEPNPISYYGETKYQAEKIVQGKAMIIRPAYPYRAKYEIKSDFVKSIRSLLEQNKPISMVTDSTITPTFIDNIAYALKYLFNNFSTQIYHIVGADSISSYDAGKLIAKTFGYNENLIQPTTYAQYFNNKAKRPQYSQIKTKNNTFYKMKTFAEGLADLKKQIS